MGDVNNTVSGTVHGNALLAGGDIHTTEVPADVLAAVARLRAAVSAVELTSQEREVAERELSDVEREMRSTAPDKDAVAARLQRLTRLLKATAGMAAAGAGLLGPISVIGGWLGPLGAGLLRAVR